MPTTRACTIRPPAGAVRSAAGGAEPVRRTPDRLTGRAPVRVARAGQHHPVLGYDRGRIARHAHDHGAGAQRTTADHGPTVAVVTAGGTPRDGRWREYQGELATLSTNSAHVVVEAPTTPPCGRSALRSRDGRDDRTGGRSGARGNAALTTEQPGRRDTPRAGGTDDREGWRLRKKRADFH